MKLHRSVLITSAGIGLLALTGCAGTNSSAPANSPAASAPVENSPVADSPVTESPASQTTAAASGSHGGQGGQTIESGPYHLEFSPGAEADGTHLDFYLQKGDNHEAIPDAKVTAQVQLPDGTQKTLDLKYDAAGEHYTVLLPATAAGEYKVAILSDVGGEKVNGRFTFTK